MSKIRLFVMMVLLLAALGLTACGLAASPSDAPAVEVPAGEAPASEPSAGDASNASAGAAEAEATAEPTVAANNPVTFALLADETEARFHINEVLTGQPTEVIGTTSAVTGGDISVDYANPSAATVSPITVDLSTLVTDNNFRNRAIQDAILQSGQSQFQFATFTPTSFSGLPDSVTLGEPITFQITGNMTLHGVTKELTFDATVTPVSETRLEGSASTSILYQDFDVNILRLPPQVASVEDSVILEIDFVAVSG